MARQIIMLDGFLDSTDASNTNRKNVSGVYWLVAPANRVKPLPNFVSLVPSSTLISTYGVTSGELTNLQNGSIVEQPFSKQYAPGTTAATVEADLQGGYTSAQTALNNLAMNIKIIGAFFDGTSWTAAP